MFALVDCNNFYAACETVFNPALRKQPVVVLSHNDGCVIARSAAAKALGIEMGMPGFQLTERFPSTAIHLCSSNFTLYGSLSARIQYFLEAAAPGVEIYSIDEAFLDLSDCDLSKGSLRMAQLRTQIEEQVGITVSIGLAPTKTLAKLVNRLAKKNPEGVVAMADEKDIEDLLAHTDIADVWGIGDQHARRCRAAGIHSAWALRMAPKAWIQKHLSVLGERLQQELLGISCLSLELSPAPKKSMVVGRSFGQLLSNPSDILEAVTAFTYTCAEKLRQQASMAGSMQVRLQTQVHRSDLVQTCRQVQYQFPQPLQDSLSLAQWARKAINQLYQEGVHYKKASVLLFDLQTEQSQQSSLFEVEPLQKKKALMQSMDEINRKFGRLQVRPATLSTTPRWSLRQHHRSKRYTTRIDELLVVHAK